MPVRVAVIEDHEATRRGWRATLDTSPGYECVAECASAEDARRRFRKGAWDLALVDVRLPGRSGLSLVHWLKETEPKLRCLVITAVNDSQVLVEAFRAGADGYLVKRGDPKHLLARLEEIRAGEIPMSPGIARRLLQVLCRPMSDPRLEQLTPSERRVLLALSEGSSNKELAEHLSLSEATVRSHLSKVFAKLRVRGRAEAVAWVHRLNAAGAGAATSPSFEDWTSS